MGVADAVEIHIFEDVRRFWAALRINPLIGSRGVLGLSAAQQQRAAGDQRGVELVPALRVFTIHMETEIANFLTCAPFQQHTAARAGLRMEGRKLHGRRGLNG